MEKISVPKAARLSGKSYTWWKYRIDKGEIQFEKIDNRKFIPKSEVERVIREDAETAKATNTKHKGLYKIEKNIPLSGVQVREKYPLSSMEVGDSFLIPFGDHEANKMKNVGHGIRWKAKNTFKGEREFTTRRVDGGVRVWRIK